MCTEYKILYLCIVCKTPWDERERRNFPAWKKVECPNGKWGCSSLSTGVHDALFGSWMCRSCAVGTLASYRSYIRRRRDAVLVFECDDVEPWEFEGRGGTYRL